MRITLFLLLFGLFVMPAGANDDQPLTFEYSGGFSLTGASAGISVRAAELKNCITEAKLMMFTGRAGTTNCGISVQVFDEELVFDTAQTRSVTVPPQLVPQSLKAVVIGGGGGGGAGNNCNTCYRRNGYGGHPAEYKEASIPDALPGDICTITVGAQGASTTGEGQNGNRGGDSSLNCSGVLRAAKGGAGGLGKQDTNNCGTDGRDLEDERLSVPFKGSPGRCDNNDRTFVVGYGAGGGGGSKYAGHRMGKPGGRGAVIFRYKKFDLTIPEGALSGTGLTKESLIATVYNTGETCQSGVEGILTEWTDWSTCQPSAGSPTTGTQHRTRSCLRPSGYPKSCPAVPCSGPTAEERSCVPDQGCHDEVDGRTIVRECVSEI
jgi:hypothetical protein